MILAWASPFNYMCHVYAWEVTWPWRQSWLDDIIVAYTDISQTILVMIVNLWFVK